MGLVWVAGGVPRPWGSLEIPLRYPTARKPIVALSSHITHQKGNALSRCFIQTLRSIKKGVS